MNSPTLTCTHCILNSQVDPDIVIDDKGICNHCNTYWEVENLYLHKGQEGENEIQSILKELKDSRKGKQYDCIIGLSGGLDSSYIAYYLHKMGLNPLAVHLDNGWNSKLAVKNIQNIVNKLDIDLYTHVIDWEEFRDIQLAYLKASVVDIEFPTDSAIVAILYEMAIKHDTPCLISGDSFATEGFLPASWVHHKHDLMNFHAIIKRFGNVKLKTFPQLGYARKIYLEKMGKVKWMPVLDYLDYERDEAKKIISKELGWEDYGWKHYESIFTRFYQGYILPEKFNIDKRWSHLSTLICSKHITREEALKLVAEPIYDPAQLEEDKVYILKKFGLTQGEFDDIMNSPIKAHTDYPSILNIYKKLRPLIKVYKLFRGK